VYRQTLTDGGTAYRQTLTDEKLKNGKRCQKKSILG
jgi:hypothetical protein